MLRIVATGLQQISLPTLSRPPMEATEDPAEQLGTSPNQVANIRERIKPPN